MNTMADFRCGRRKQANPRKKNVDEESGDPATELKPSEECGEEGSHDGSAGQPHTDEMLPEDSPAPQPAPPVQPDSTQDTPLAQEGTDATPPMDAPPTPADGTLNQQPTEGAASPPHTPDDLADELGENPDHINAEYGDEFMLRCNFCSKGFQRMAQLREHSREVHGEDISPFQCSKCHASYAVKSQLEKHMAFHSPTSQVCKICHKTFANVYRLQRHMLSHSESSDLRKFKCLECGKAFKFKHHLKEHIRIHSGEKPFSCSNCGKRFSHSGSYSSHMTSKKCWVVNMKGRPGQPQPPSEEQMRALAPKLDQNGMDMSMTTAYANAYQAAMAQAYHMGFDQHLAPPFLGINGIRPFLPFSPFGNLPNPLVPNVSTAGPAFTFPPTTTTDTSINNENLEVLSKVAAQQALLPEKTNEKEQNGHKSPGLDFNQNNKGPVTSQIHCRQQAEDQPEGTKENRRPVLGESEDSESDSEDSDSGDSSSEHTDSRSSGQQDDLSSVRKILEVVEATVAKQRQNQPDKAKISKLVQMSLREQAQEDPMTLAGRARQVLQEHLKNVKPTSGESSSDSDRASGNENQASSENKKLVKCKYCPLEFCSPVQLHQHERYLCKSNDHIPKVPIVVPIVMRPGGYQKDKNGLNWDPYCKHCRTKFDSPVELHQHERYLCSENREIRGLVGTGDFIKMENGPLSNGMNDVGSRASDSGSIDYRNEQRIRSRSNISEEQLQVLKSHYKQNPRPTRDELQLLAVQLGFPKRVVQVWFQNRRAQEKRVGRIQTGYHDNLPSAALDWEKSTKNGAAYIPVVPQFQPSSQSQSMVCYPLPQSNVSISTSNGQYANSSSGGTKPISTPTFSNQMEPLDLSTKKKEGHSWNGHSPGLLDSPENEENGVLNLSKRRPGDSQSSFEESVIYKYLHKDKEGERDRSYLSPRSLSSPEAHQLHIDPKAASTPAHLSSPGGYLSPSPSDLTSPRSSLESSFNSSLDSAGLDQAAVRAKRARRKSWRQVGPDVEAEETQLELGEDALTVDEDFPRKKRKCWKYHKLDAPAEEGMYSCDQCDKLFSKQSSLARHKYEHSGQRPFNCDICCKAFKHKHHLTEHKRLHSGEKPFQCKKCGKRFSHSGSFSQHMNHRYKYCKPLRMEDSF